MDLLNSSNLEQLALKGSNHYQNEHVTCYINSSGDYSCERMRVAILVPLFSDCIHKSGSMEGLGSLLPVGYPDKVLAQCNKCVVHTSDRLN